MKPAVMLLRIGTALTLLLLLDTAALWGDQTTSPEPNAGSDPLPQEAIGRSLQEDILTYQEAAVQTKENIDYQPFIVSIYHGKELEKIGIATLEEALMLVPGIDIFSDSLNLKSVSFRGSNPMAFGQSKLFIDEILVNDLQMDGYTPYLQMPIELIKRIEVTRGPGSQIEGVNAYAGSIRVFTYAEDVKGLKKDNRIFIKGGSDQAFGGGTTLHTEDEGIAVDLDFFYQQDDTSRNAGYDALSQGTLGEANKQFSQNGDASLALQNFSLGLALSSGGWSFKSRLLKYNQDAAYGVNYALPGDNDSFKLPRAYFELARTKQWNQDWESEIKLGFLHDAFQLDTRALPPGVIYPTQSNPNQYTIYTDGFYSHYETRQQQWYQSGTIRYRGLPGHLISGGWRLGWDKTTYQKTVSTNRDTGVGLVDYSDTFPFADENARRNSLVLFLEDRYEINDAATLLFGLNFADNSHISPAYNPRFALVYPYSSQRIVKLLYSRSIRSPSWQELYIMNNQARVGNRNLDPEKVDAFEIEHIWSFLNDQHLQFNLFHLINRDQISRNPETHQYQNRNDGKNRGIEIEYRGHLCHSDSLYANYTWQYATVNGAPAPYVARHLAKGYYLYRLTPNFSTALHATYISKKRREADDPRDDLDAYIKTDWAVNYFSSYLDAELSMRINNLFDSDIRTPSEPFTYADDYPLGGRTFLLTLKKEF